MFKAYDKQIERRRIQDTNLLTLIILHLTRASNDRLKFGFVAQYAGVGTSGIALVKLLLISHRPLPKVLDRVVIIMYDKLKMRRQDGRQMEVHVNHFRVGVQKLLDMGQNHPENALVNAFVTFLDQSAIDQFNIKMDRNITFPTLEFAMKTALEIDMQARTHFNGSTDVSPATAKAFVAEERMRERDIVEHSGSDEPAPSKSRASRRPRDPPSGKDEPAPSESRTSRRPRDPPSGKSDASPVPQRSDEHKNVAERYTV